MGLQAVWLQVLPLQPCSCKTSYSHIFFNPIWLQKMWLQPLTTLNRQQKNLYATKQVNLEHKKTKHLQITFITKLLKKKKCKMQQYLIFNANLVYILASNRLKVYQFVLCYPAPIINHIFAFGVDVTSMLSLQGHRPSACCTLLLLCCQKHRANYARDWSCLSLAKLHGLQF